MQAYTYAQIDRKVRRDLDLQDDENFVPYDEMAGYCNDAIDSAEAIILKIHEDYFLTKTSLALFSGQSDVDLPSNIYAQKIRALIYANGTRIYPVKRLKDPHSFLKRAMVNYQANNTDEYAYILRLDSGDSQCTMELVPAAYETASDYLTMWYIRNAARIPEIAEGSSRATQLATVIDIPEFRSYLEQFMKVRCYEKMKDWAAHKDAKESLKLLKDQMVDTLTDRVPDLDDEVPQDTSHYEEHN